ncbi:MULTISPECIES: hypothetical protein [unclassified Streptomyces]|uniref:hypothetical protein n=1 Tax=unclassified Streptomyces TaxID=2593676 RepID=UPI001660BE69|nr:MULTISPECIES: hypothetical protein [unclassified Streptomyces]MBD0710070.1 hypothetical protein [Streptomyces sp. CBMA291]MBD0715639.1 hypothetical protein [Streptomyces sp. CBMA370]
MATPERAEPTPDHVPMSELLASCVAARTLSTPPPRTGPERPGHGYGKGRPEPVTRTRAA